MGILTKLLSKFKKSGISRTNSCYFCHRKASDLRHYKNDQNKKIAVCHLCVEYAKKKSLSKTLRIA